MVTAEDCKKELPVCNDGVAVVPIDAPCERYKVCDWFDALTTVNECSGAEVFHL